MAKKTTGDGTHQKGAKHGYMYGQGFEVFDSKAKAMMKSGSSIQAFSQLSNNMDCVFGVKPSNKFIPKWELGVSCYFRELVLKYLILH